MIVNDTLSTILTLQGWYIANQLFVILNATNLFMLMFAVIIFQVWADVGQEGEDEGNKGLLGLNRSEIRLILACGVFLFALMPVFPLAVNTLTFDDDKSYECGVGVSSGHSNANVSTFNNQTVRAPLWWYFWHSVTQGLTNASVSSLPCSYDVSNSLLALSQLSIKSEPLRQEIQDFYQQCYTRAYINMKAAAREGKVTQDDYDHATWIGDSHFLSNRPDILKTTYHGLQAENIVFTFPYNAKRDDPIQQRYRRTEVDTQAAYPMCDEWWNSQQTRTDGETAGLRWRIGDHVANQNKALAKQVIYKDGLFDRLLGNKTTQAERVDMLIQRSLSIENLQTKGRTVRGYAQVIDKNWTHEFGELWNLSVGSSGLFLGHMFTGPVFFIVREAMPILQSILMTVVVIASPIILMLSAYSVSTLMSLTLTYCGLMYLTFWWEVCRSLDSKLVTAIYQHQDDLNPITATLNVLDDVIVKLVILILYVMVPVMWFGLLGFTGYKVNSLGMDSAIDKVSSTTQKGVDSIKGTVKQGMSNN